MATTTALLEQLRASLTSSKQFSTHSNDAGDLVIANDKQHWQIVAREHRNGRDHAAILLAPICDQRSASPVRILELAGQMGAGALALVGGAYVVRYAIPAPQVQSAPLETILAYLHDVARSVEAGLASIPAADVSSLAHLGM